jgi:hypothetical protein
MRYVSFMAISPVLGCVQLMINSKTSERVELRAGCHASVVNSGGSAHDDRGEEGKGGSDEAERAGGTGGEAEDARARAERRLRLDAVFGAAPADPTRDDTVPERRPTSREDEWYLENRPPHHG